MKQRSRFYPRVQVDTSRSGAVGQAGGVLLTETVAATGLDAAISAALAPWRRPTARHDPGKVVLDLAISLAIGGDCLADIGSCGAHAEVFGPVPSDRTVSRLIDTLAWMRPRRWPRCTAPAPGPGRWPASTLPITAGTRPRRWSTTSLVTTARPSQAPRPPWGAQGGRDAVTAGL